MGISSATNIYFDNSVKSVGSVAEKAKNLRNTPNFFQKACILQKGLINAFNYFRETNQLGKAVKLLDAGYMVDYYAAFPMADGWYKPININSIHRAELADRLHNDYGFDLIYAKDAISELMDRLDFVGKHATGKFGYSTADEFKSVLKKKLSEGTRNHPIDEESREAVNIDDLEIPLKGESWLQWLTNNTFNFVTISTVAYYFREWNLLDTGRLAANIGSVRGLGLVNKLDFMKVYSVSLSAAFLFFFLESARRFYSATGTLLTHDQNEDAARKNAKWAMATALFESIYFGAGTLSALGYINSNVGFVALSLVAAKTIGKLMIVNATYDPFERVPVAQPRLYDRAKTKVSNLVSKLPGVALVTHSAPYIWVANKIHDIVTVILEALGDINSLPKDGTDKFYKSFLPKLKLADLLMKNPLFTKMRETLEFHKRLIYATKIFNSIPNWINSNGWSYPGFKQALLDLANLLDTARFFREYDIISYQKLVNYGTAWSKTQFRVFGKSVELDSVPVLRDLWNTPKNVPLVIAAVMELNPLDSSSTVSNMWEIGLHWRSSAEEEVPENEKLWWFMGAQSMNALKCGVEIGKILIISLSKWSKDHQIKFAILESCTGDSGLVKYFLEQYKYRRPFAPTVPPAA